MSLIRSVVVSSIRSRGARGGALVVALAATVAACDRSDTEPAAAPRDTAGAAAGGTMPASAASLLGRWEKQERTLPPVALELRVDAADRVTGRVWLSGVTYEAPAVLDDTSFVLGAGRPTMRGSVTADRRLRVRFLKADGSVDREELLAKVR